MRKGLILGLGLAALVFVLTSIPAHAGVSVRFRAGVPVYRAPIVIVQPRVYAPPPVIVSPPLGLAQPFYAPRPVYIPGRWSWTAWGWQWAPGYWIR
jgi:hypothetical protein